MAREIHNLEDLERINYITKYDYIFFHTEKEILRYQYTTTFMKYVPEDKIIEPSNNAKIFLSLNIPKDRKNKLAKNCYGYEPKTGDWPEYKDGDINGAKKLIAELYKIIEKKNKDINYLSFHEKIHSRFEILDL